MHERHNIVKLSKDFQFVDVAFENLPREIYEKVQRAISTLVLESRTNIEEQFELFLELCMSTKTPQILIVKGEWGEGKTTLISVYSEKLNKDDKYSQNIISYTVRMDDVLPIFERKLNEHGPWYPAKKFLAAILEAVREKIKIKGQLSMFPKLSDIREVSTNLEDVLRILSKNRTHVIFFIDEFEAIFQWKGKKVHNREIVDLVVEAIRGARGGGFNELIEKGGVIPHFVLSMTPYAYSEYVSKLGMEFKGWEQRRRYIIELRPLTRRDVETIISTLIKKVYFSEDTNIEDVFEDERYIDILFTVSQGNIGALVDSFNKLIAMARQKYRQKYGNSDGIIKISADLIIETLTQNKIYTYVGESEGIDRILYMETIGYINQELGSERYVTLWKKFVASSSIFFDYELNEQDIVLLNKVLLNKFGKEPIIKVELYPYPTGSKIEDEIVDILSLMNPGLDKEEIMLAIRRVLVNIGGMRYLPLPPYDYTNRRWISEIISKILSFSNIVIISPDKVKAIYDILERETQNDKQPLIGYWLSPEVQERIYPAPPIFVLDFVDPSRALQLWKSAYDEVVHNPETIERNVMLLLINNIPSLKIENARLVYQYDYGGKKIPLKVDLFVFMYNPENRMEIIRQTIREEGRIPVIIAKDSIYDLLKKKIEDLNLSSKTVIIPLPEVTLVQLAIIEKLIQKQKRNEIELKVDIERLKRKLNEIIGSLNIDEKIQNLISNLRADGYVLEDFKRVTEKGISELLDIYFMLLLGGSEFTLEELWENNLTKISTTLLYGRGVKKPVVLKYDVETFEQFKKLVRRVLVSFKENGLISETADGKIIIQMTPVEKKILEILKEYKDNGHDSVSIQELRKHFIDMSRSAYDILEKFLMILKWRGEIDIKNKTISLLSEVDINKRLNMIYEEFEKKKNEILSKYIVQENPALAHIAMFKKHKELFIDIDNIDSIVQSYVNKRYSLSKAQKMLISDYIEYVIEVLFGKMTFELNEIERTKQQVEESLADMKIQLKQKIEPITEIYPDLEIQMLSEYRTLSAFEEKISELMSKSKEVLKKELKHEHKTNKGSIDKHPMFFSRDVHNYVRYLLKKIEEEVSKYKENYLRREFSRIDEAIQDLNEYRYQINRLQDKIQEMIRKYNITNVKIPELKEKQYPVTSGYLTLADLTRMVEGYIENQLKRHYEGLKKLYNSLDNLIRTYNEDNTKLMNFSNEQKKLIRDLQLLKGLCSKTFSDGGYLINCEKVTELEETLKKLDSNLEQARDVLSKIFLSEAYILKLENLLSQIEKIVIDVQSSIKTEIERISDHIRVTTSQADSVVSFLKELHANSIIELPDDIVLEYKDVASLSKKIAESITANNSYRDVLLHLERSINDLDTLKHKLQKLYQFMAGVDNNVQVSVFRILANNPHISLKDLLDALQGKFSEIEIIRALVTLERKGLLKSTISLVK
ncbi:hypothetical protein X802_02840 [Thermococcus guaymasensis DSM 11113]|uniref:Ubiquitin-like domain-containing protein n=2 Tax=Thermococcus guaymasensis TaxID=110164 RepID=A0A0X1KN14_9EURY|nr:hypothetical protein X802_02840 [Thermococcus guaymasensis DSM 11113]